MKKIHVFSGWLLLICMAAIAGICTARYETEIQKTTTVKAQTESRIAFSTDDLRKEADTYTIPYVVKNTSDRQAVYGICVRASLGIEDAENLEITLEQEKATYTGKAEVIEEGSVLAQQFGDGWVYRFYKENKECTWQLDSKDEEKTGTLTFSWKKDADGNAYVPKYVSHLNVAACELDSNGHPYFLEQSEDLVLDPADDVTDYQGEFLTEGQSVQLADWIIPEVTVDSGETGSDAGTGESIDKSNSTDTDTEENDTSAEPESLDEDEGAEVSVQTADKVDTSEIEVQTENEAEVPMKMVAFALPKGVTETPTVVVDDASQKYVEASVSESDGEGKLTLTATPAVQQLTEAQRVKMTVTYGSYSAVVRVRLIPYGQESSLDSYDVTDRKASLLAVYAAKREDAIHRVKVEKTDGNVWTGVRYSLDQGQTWIAAYEGEFSFKDPDGWNGLLLLDLSAGDGEDESKDAVTVKMDQEAQVSELPDSGILQTHFLLRGYGRKQDKGFTLDPAWNKFTFSYKIQKLKQIPEEELLAAQEADDTSVAEALKWKDLTEEELKAFSVTEKDAEQSGKNWVIAIPDSGTRPEAGSYRLVLRWGTDDALIYERVLDFFVEYERLT